MKFPSDMSVVILRGWKTFQDALVASIVPLDEEKLALRAAPHLRSVNMIARHIVGARARWFYGLFGEGGEDFKRLGAWDRTGAPNLSGIRLAEGLNHSWDGMASAIGSWSPGQWKDTWPGEDDTEPEVLTRQWVIWHLIEHDLYHGGEISIILGAHGIRAVGL